MNIEKRDTVTTTHPRFDASAVDRQTWLDVIAGTSAMRRAGKQYLPKFPAEQDASYEVRRTTTPFLNISKKTLESLCGLVFQKDLTLNDDVPTEITELVENIDNKGNHLNVFAHDVFECSFDGWAGILVDYPPQKASDRGEQITRGIRPYWVAYKASDVVNWDYEVNPISRRLELALVVLREKVTSRVGQFIRDEVTQYRVLQMVNGVATWQVWEPTQRDGEYAMTGSGVFSSQKRLPFAVIGELGDCPPMMDLAHKNVEHYQAYSDYMSLKHKTAVPLFYTVNLEGEPEAIGGDVWFRCSEQGSIGWAATDPGALQSHVEGLENIKREMGQLGLSMLASQPVKGDTTATETMLDSIQETSSLQVRATQLKDAMELALGFTANYMRKESGGSITLGATWSQMVLTAQEISAMSSLYDLGLLSKESFVAFMHQAGKLPDDVDVDEELRRIEADDKERMENLPVINAGKMPNEDETKGEEFAEAV